MNNNIDFATGRNPSTIPNHHSTAMVWQDDEIRQVRPQEPTETLLYNTQATSAMQDMTIQYEYTASQARTDDWLQQQAQQPFLVRNAVGSKPTPPPSLRRYRTSPAPPAAQLMKRRSLDNNNSIFIIRRDLGRPSHRTNQHTTTTTTKPHDPLALLSPPEVPIAIARPYPGSINPLTLDLNTAGYDRVNAGGYPMASQTGYLVSHVIDVGGSPPPKQEQQQQLPPSSSSIQAPARLSRRKTVKEKLRRIGRRVFGRRGEK